jgi:DNA-binding CsgD family transcriptional regulator
MRVTDPALSRRLYEIENDLRTDPHRVLEGLLTIEDEVRTLTREDSVRVKLLRVRALVQVQDYESARQLLMETRGSINSKSDTELSAMFDGLFARLKYEASEPSQALSLIESSLGVLSAEPIDPQLAKTLHESNILAAHCCINVAEYVRAIDYLLESVALVQRFGLEKGYVSPLHVLGRIYLHLKEYEEAKNCAHAAIRLHFNDQRFSYSQYLLAACHLNCAEISDCLDACASSFIQSSTPSLGVNARILLARAFCGMGELNVARNHLNEARSQAESLKLSRELTEIKLCEASILRAEGDDESALSCINEILDDPAAQNVIRLRYQILTDKLRILHDLERHEEASELHKELAEMAFESHLLEQHSKMIHEHDLNQLHGTLGLPPLIKNLSTAASGQIHDTKASLLESLSRRLDSLLEVKPGQLSSELQAVAAELQALIKATGNEAEYAEERLDEKNFRANLLKINPAFTSSELKVCAWIRDDKSSSQIAYALGTSVRTIDTHRSRIRKKLGLANSDNLRSFLLRV